MKNKGFTLVELLATMVILAILILIGTMTVSNIFDNSKENYYKSMENTLGIAGNEFFNDNRDDKPIDDYNFVDLKTLQEHEYLEELKTFDGKDLCDDSTGVYIYNDDNGNNYEVCLVCGEYKSKGEFCNGKKFGTINITGNINTPNGPFYNPLLSYSGTSWINASVIYVHFSLNDNDVNVSQYKIYSSTSNTLYGTCNASGNKCSYRMETTGSYYVEAYDGSEKVANRKYFNIKLDGTPPSFDLKNNDPEFELSKDDILYDYENEVININDDNGYRSVIYTLTRYNPTKTDNIEYIAREVDIKDQDLKINHQLESGKYDLYVRVIDFAGNDSNKHISFYIKYRVDLQYYDNKDMKHDVGSLKVYTYGHYDNLPAKINLNNNSQEVDWYQNPQLSGTAIMRVTLVEKTGYHILYGREQKLKTTFGVTCNNLVYNGQNQVLSEIPSSESGKYRLLVYYDGKLMANEAKDARKYTVIAILNSEYIWSDGSKAAKSIQCEIMPKQVPLPECTNPTYTPRTSQALINVVDDSGKYYEFGELAISVTNNTGDFTEPPIKGMNAGSYTMTASLNTSHNFSWDGAYDFSNKQLNCSIKRLQIGISSNSISCASNLIYNGSPQSLIDLDSVVSDDTFYEFESGWGGHGDAPENIYITNNYDLLSDREGIATVSPGTEINHGTYTVNIKLDPNYAWSGGSFGNITKKCTIEKATITPQPFSLDYQEVLAFQSSPSNFITDNLSDYFYDINATTGEGINATDDVFGLKYTITSINKKNNNFRVRVSLEFYICYQNNGLCSGADNYQISPSTITCTITDSVPPVCGTTSVSTAGVITFTATDNYKFSNESTSDSKTQTITSAGTYKHEFKDAFDNSSGECSITVKKQKRTATCDTITYSSECGEWEQDYSACVIEKSQIRSNMSCNKCKNGYYQCKTCVAYSPTGCSSYNSWSGWSDDNSCSASSGSSYPYTKVQCRYIKG